MTSFAAGLDGARAAVPFVPPDASVRLGVLDVGSNTVHLLMVDAHWGATPTPVWSERWTLKLAELIGPDGTLGTAGIAQVVAAVGAAAAQARAAGCDELIAFATSAIRDAADSDAVIAAIGAATRMPISVLTGADEARLTFLAARRWFGWSAGNLLVLDMGGGSLEVAGGIDERPTLAVSLPLGAGRLHRSWFSARATTSPPGPVAVAELTDFVARQLEPVRAQVVDASPFERVVGTSKTFRTLARLAGAAPNAEGPLVPRSLTVQALAQVSGFLARMTPADVGTLEGVSPERAAQLAAGSAIALAALAAVGADRIDICPWALREGVILERLDQIAFDS